MVKGDMIKVGGRVNLRLPDDLWAWLTKHAHKSDRSRNKQVVSILREVKAREDEARR